MNPRKDRGSVLVAVALFLMLLLGFGALGTEAGRWFLVRAELSKSVDAAALAGAKNISNPHVDPKVLAAEFCAENFQGGAYGTVGSGPGGASFDVQLVDGNKVKVQGTVGTIPILGKVLGLGVVPVSAVGVAQVKSVEIMLILDRSGSMFGQPMTDLKNAAVSFLDYFAATQNRDRMGLISYSTAARVDRPMATNFVAAMQTSIRAMSANGYTNSEDAIDRANGPGGFTDQSGLPPDARVQQFAIFFSDGRANTFRWTFRHQGADHDAISHAYGNCDPGDDKQINQWLYDGNNAAPLAFGNTPTGNGVSACNGNPSTRWNVFDAFPIPGYSPDACNIPEAALYDYTCITAADLAVHHAQALKDAGVVVFAIGLGKTNPQFLERVASSPRQVYYSPTSSELQALFQRVAQDIKLALVE